MGICEITLNIPKIKEKALYLQQKLPGVIAATMQLQRGMLFDQSGNYNGHEAWKSLKCREGQPLKDRGTLSQSIGPMNNGIIPVKSVGSIVRLSNEIVTIGTNIAYALIQNYGGIIKPIKAKSLRFKCNGKYVFRKKVTIPARNFNDITNEDVSELTETIQNFIINEINS